MPQKEGSSQENKFNQASQEEFLDEVVQGIKKRQQEEVKANNPTSEDRELLQQELRKAMEKEVDTPKLHKEITGEKEEEEKTKDSSDSKKTQEKQKKEEKKEISKEALVEEKKRRQEEFQKHLTAAEKVYANNWDNPLNRENIADLIRESGVLEEESEEKRQEIYKDIWKKIKEVNKHFLKFDGSGYYENTQNEDLWKNRSAANVTSGQGYKVVKMFDKFIGDSLEDYWQLLQVYDDMGDVAEAIEYLEEQEKKVDVEQLKAVAKTGEYKNTEKQGENKESPEKIKKDDLVYYMEKEMRRWRDPKEIVAIKTVDGEKYAKFADDDSLYPLSKLKLAEDVEKGETEYQPGPKGATPSLEDLESISNADNLAFKKFESRFGISYEELKEMEGFPQDEVKQRWLLENLTQLTVGRIELEAEKRKEKALDAKIPDEWKKDSGSRLKNFVKATKIGFRKVRNKIKKENHKASFEQQILEEIQSGGIAEHGDTLKQLIDSLSKTDFGIRINNETDKLKFDFVEIPEGASEREVEVLRNYNEAADRMAHIPDDWRLDSASRSHQKEYRQAKEAYDAARSELYKLRMEQDEFDDNELAVSEYLNEKDYGVRINQLFNTDPELEKELGSIANDRVWWRSTKKAFNKKTAINALIGAGGFATRWATGAVTWGVGSAAASMGFGALRGRLEAGRKLEAKSKEARYGGIDKVSGLEELVKVRDQIIATEEELSSAEEKEDIGRLKEKRRNLFKKRDELVERQDIRQKLYEVGALVNADDLMERIERDIRLIEGSEPDSNQRESRLGSLEARIQYTINKLDQGVVNFGANSSDIAFNKMNLMQLLSQAQIATETYSREWGDNVFEQWRQDVGLKDEEKVKRARNEFKKKEMWKSAKASGAFFLTGYGLRWLGETFGWWDGPVFDSSEVVEDSGQLPQGSVDPDSVEVPGMGGSTDSSGAEGVGMGGSTEEAQAQVGVGESTEESSGGGQNQRVGPGDSTEEAQGQEGSGDSTVKKEKDVGFGESTIDSASADSTDVAIDLPDANDTPPPPPNYETEALGTQDFIIDEKGEGMIHAIADGLEDKHDISHEKAMEIGNKLFIKGEQLKGDDELYNLVGEGATFRLDFADLTEADLEDLSADELVEKIDFDNEEDFTAGESGIKGLELPEEEAVDTSVESTATKSYDPSVDQYGRYEDSPIESGEETLSEAEDRDRKQKMEEWQQKLREKSAGVEEGGGAEEVADSSTETTETPTEATSESSVETEQPTAAKTETEVEALRADVVERDTTEYINDRVDDLLKSVPADTSGEYKEISVNALGELNEYLDANRNQDIVTTIEKLGQDNPRLLLTLDKVVSPKEGTNPPGSLLDRLSGYISNAITEAENDGRLSQALREKVAIDKAHLDALASAEVTSASTEEMSKEVKGLSSELNQYADKTNKGEGAKEKIGKLEEAFWRLERTSNKAGSGEGARFFGGIRDLLDDASDVLEE